MGTKVLQTTNRPQNRSEYLRQYRKNNPEKIQSNDRKYYEKKKMQKEALAQASSNPNFLTYKILEFNRIFSRNVNLSIQEETNISELVKLRTFLNAQKLELLPQVDTYPENTDIMITIDYYQRFIDYLEKLIEYRKHNK
jgi:hypothetical protein